jgi:hypothetical protein
VRITPTRFTRLCVQYGIGEQVRFSGQRAVELSPSFLTGRLGVHIPLTANGADNDPGQFDGGSPPDDASTPLANTCPEHGDQQHVDDLETPEDPKEVAADAK